MSLNTARDEDHCIDIEPPPPECHPGEKLRFYIKSARIPRPRFREGRPPIPRGKDRVTPGSFLLPIHPDRCFMLRVIRAFEPDVMEDKALAFILKTIPSHLVVSDTEDQGLPPSSRDFYLPAPGFVSSVEPLLLIQNAVELTQATLQVLKTAERVVNLVWSAGQNHIFAPQTPFLPVEGDTPFCLPLFYAKIQKPDEADLYRTRTKMAVIVMTPWALSKADMEDMVTLRQLPSIQGDGSWPRWTRAHKVWAQVELSGFMLLRGLTSH